MEPKILSVGRKATLNPSQTKNVDASKLKEFAADNLKLDGNGKKFPKRATKHCGKRRNCSVGAIFPFPTVFSKDLYMKHRKNQGLFGKGLNKWICSLANNSFSALLNCLESDFDSCLDRIVIYIESIKTLTGKLAGLMLLKIMLWYR